uniref:Uncharacterized protein n=1 Tax=Arundo donax TaxID=35708 RepID=A0A0A9H5A4_ARUDO
MRRTVAPPPRAAPLRRRTAVAPPPHAAPPRRQTAIAHRRIQLLKAEAAMNATGLRHCIEDKDAMAAASTTSPPKAPRSAPSTNAI